MSAFYAPCEEKILVLTKEPVFCDKSSYSPCCLDFSGMEPGQIITVGEFPIMNSGCLWGLTNLSDSQGGTVDLSDEDAIEAIADLHVFEIFDDGPCGIAAELAGDFSTVTITPVSGLPPVPPSTTPPAPPPSFNPGKRYQVCVEYEIILGSGGFNVSAPDGGGGDYFDISGTSTIGPTTGIQGSVGSFCQTSSMGPSPPLPAVQSAIKCCIEVCLTIDPCKHELEWKIEAGDS